MIKIILQNGTPYVWEAADWLRLREEFRIVGNLTGCLAGLPRQEAFQGLPVALLPEEVTLLLEKNLACVVNDDSLKKDPDDETRRKFLSYKEENRNEQMAYYEAQRKQQITMMIDRIIEGKRRKLMGLNTKKKKVKLEDNSKEEDSSHSDFELDRDKILETELSKSSATTSPPLLLQTFTRDPWCNISDDAKIDWNFPETASDKLKYAVFRDLWEKKLYITEGHKFGVDYLVYPGDPVKFHAQFLIVCKEYTNNFSSVDLISYARLGSISRKSFVIASLPPDSDDILYLTFQWTEKN